MLFSKKQLGIIYLDKDKFDFYPSKGTNMYTFTFSKEMVDDLDVVNIDIFITEVKKFIEQNHILPSPLLIFLSQQILFEKEIKIQDQEQQSIEIQTFLYTVPFENVSSIIIQNKTQKRVIATNLDLYQGVQKAFEMQKFIVDMVLPVTILPQNTIGADNKLNLQAKGQLLQKLDTLKQGNFLTKKEEQVLKTQGQQTQSFFTKYKSIIVIVFFIFSILLLGFALLSFLNAGVKKSSVQKLESTTQPTPAPIPLQEPNTIQGNEVTSSADLE